MTTAGQSVVERVRRHVEVLAAEPRSTHYHPEAMARASAYVCEQLHAAGWETTVDDLFQRRAIGLADHKGANPRWPVAWHRNLHGSNITATRPVDDPQAPVLVFVAHLDTVLDSSGADDNASAVAVLLELALLTGQLRASAAEERSRAVMVCFVDLEEVGHYGSRHLADQLVASGRRIEGVVALDAVGYFDETPGAQTMPAVLRRFATSAAAEIAAHEDRGDFLLLVQRRASASLAAAVAGHAAGAGVRTVAITDPRPAGRWRRNAYTWLFPPLANFDRSDHEPFWRRRIPAILITDTALLRSPHYHQASDLPDTLDYPRLAGLAAALAGVCTHHGR